MSAKANRTSIPIGANQWSGPALEWNPDAKRDPDEDGHRGEGLDQPAEHVADEHRGAGDGHGVKPVEMPHVHGDHDRGPWIAEATVISSSPGTR